MLDGQSADGGALPLRRFEQGKPTGKNVFDAEDFFRLRKQLPLPH